MDTDTRGAIARRFFRARGGKEIAINGDGVAEVNGTKLYYEVKGGTVYITAKRLPFFGAPYVLWGSIRGPRLLKVRWCSPI